MRRVVAAVLLVLVIAGAVTAAAPPRGSAAASRTFGDDPLDAVLFWAQVRANETGCGLTRDRLAALMLAPIWPETGAPTTQAPGPMTLSRWDTATGLYSFSNPSSYVDAFWHPGVGMWQFDSAGGWGMSAADRIDVWTAASFASDVMANRYCTNSSRSYVWMPWHGCNSGVCETIYKEIYQGGRLVGLDRVASVTSSGGMEQRSCSVGGGAAFACWYVDPSRAQGANGWTVPAWGAAPVSDPFYVFTSGSKEERHWLRSHSGYPVDISATRSLGSNARTSLTWSTSSELCDETSQTGSCSATPPAGFSAYPVNVTGTYIPLTGDFNGDGIGDVFWYGPGTAYDTIWYGKSGTGFRSESVEVKGTYEPLVGDFDGNGASDILWYGPGTAKDAMWLGKHNGFNGRSLTVNGSYTPVTGDFNRDGFDDVFWYGPGAAYDTIWEGSTTGVFSSRASSVNGAYEPFTGDFDGDGSGDIFWYGPGTAYDTIWLGGSSGFTTRATNVSGDYVPATGDFDGDGLDDVIWYGPGSADDSLWYATGGGGFGTGPAYQVSTNSTLMTGDFDGDHDDDAFWYGVGSAPDTIWWAG